MRTRTYLIFWTALAISVVLIVVLAGCTSSGNQDSVIETSVARGIETALASTVKPTATNTPTPIPTPTVPPTPASSEDFFRVSKKLLEIDKLWTDITTYPAVWERATGGDLFLEVDSNALWRDERFANVRNSSGSRFPIHGDPAIFELISMAVPEELSGIKFGLIEIYKQELLSFEIYEWNPNIHQGNIEEILFQFGPINAPGQSLYKKSVLNTWAQAQMRRKILYEQWLDLLLAKDADAATVSEFKASIDK